MEDLEIGNSPRNNNGNHTEERQDTAAAAAAAMMEDNNNKNHNGERHEEPRDDDELDAELGLTASERPVLLGHPMDEDVYPRNADEGNDDADEDDDDEDDSVESVETSSPLPPPRPGLTRENPFIKRRSSMVVRRKNRVGAETGNAETYESHCKAVRDERYHHPMNPSERRWMRTSIFRRQTTLARAHDTQLQEQQTCQYRLTSRKIAQGIWNPLQLVTRDEFQTNRGLNALIADYLIWTFQTNMAAVLLVSASFYVMFTLVFAIAIYVAGRHQPDCINVGNYNFNSSGYYFMDAFSLSWQTTTTAGYGVIYPKTGSTISHSCVALTILTALESFGGVLLAGCITALIFSKMVRVQAIAAVEFCDPLVVRYGAGVMPAEDDVLSQVSSTEAELAMSSNAPASPQQRRSSNSTGNNMESMMLSRESLDRHLRYPCPVLEFRVINQLHEQAGGEICNASINVVAVTAASRASPAILQSIDLGKRRREQEKTETVTEKMMRGGALLGGSAYLAGSATSAILKKSGNALLRKSGAAAVLRQSVAMLQPPNDASLTSVPETLSTNESLEPRHESNRNNREPRYTLPLPISVIERSRQHLAVDEDPSVSFVTRRIFSKLDIETDTHPFFKRVWNIRHVLNENSPLLSNEAKRLIEENQGFWPEKLNNYHQVRKHIHFHELIGNFSGTSNVSGVTVYAQKVYLFSDLNIGYQFAQVLFQSNGGRLIVDARLLNDVTEQYRGGAEPLRTDDDNSDVKEDVARPRYQQRKQEADPSPSTKSKLTIPAAV